MQFALWAPGHFCEPEDFEHIYFGPVRNAAECAFRVNQNQFCSNKFYTGCCGSPVCACVRRGMRCEVEEAGKTEQKIFFFSQNFSPIFMDPIPKGTLFG